MMASKPRFGIIKPQGLLHRVQSWVAARFWLWYPETEQLRTKPNGPKIRIVWTSAMILWLLQNCSAAILRIGAVLFNLDGNSYWRKLKWPAQNFIPAPPKDAAKLKAWRAEIDKHKPVGQGIACSGTLLRILGEERGHYVVECIKPFSGKAPNVNPSSHPWRFAKLWEVQIGTGKRRPGGLRWPMFSQSGKAYIDKKLVELI